MRFPFGLHARVVHAVAPWVSISVHRLVVMVRFLRAPDGSEPLLVDANTGAPAIPYPKTTDMPAKAVDGIIAAARKMYR